jgi:alpha-1,6-mannosyltransferase
VTVPTEPGSAVGPVPARRLAPDGFLPIHRLPGSLTVLDITKYFGDTTGGIRTYLVEKGRYVAARPGLHQVLVVPGAADELVGDGAVRQYRIRGPRIPFDPGYRLLLAPRTTRRILEHEQPDLIELGSPWLVPWLARYANRRLGAPLIWFYHTHFPGIIAPPGPALPGWRRHLADLAWGYVRRVAGMARAVLVASDSLARILEHQGVTNVRRVALGVDLALFRPERAATREAVLARYDLPRAPLAVYLGRFTEEKQLEVLLDGWPEVRRQTGAALVLVGAGPREALLRTRARDPGIHFIPFLRDRTAVADLLAAANLYLAPGPVETFGLSAVEALASGTPVVSVDCGGVADLVRASHAGALYPAGDVEACAAVIVRMLGSDLAPFRQKARGFTELNHAWPGVFDRLFEQYRAVLGECR